MKKIISKWYLIVAAGFMVFAAFLFLFFGEKSIIAVHDNLDLFVAQFQMLKNTDSFFAHNVSVPFLGGISRDSLPSEFSLYSVLYMLMPSYYAYVTGYLLKIVIAMAGCILLAKDFCKDGYETYIYKMLGEDTARQFRDICVEEFEQKEDAEPELEH